MNVTLGDLILFEVNANSLIGLELSNQSFNFSLVKNLSNC